VWLIFVENLDLSDLHETFTTNASLDKEVPIIFGNLSGFGFGL